MKGSFKSIKNVIMIMAFGLLVVNTQAQVVASSNFSKGALTTLIKNEIPKKLELRKGGARIISAYQEGAAIIQLGDKLGLVNKQGYEICHPIYDAIHLYNNGYAAVKKNNKWTFVNKQGERLTSFRYEWVGSFENGLAAVMYDGKWGLLNEQGFEVLPTIYDAIKKDKKGNLLAKKGKEGWKLVFSESLLKA